MRAHWPPIRRVLLMDEPFGALDPITRFRLQEELRRLHREVAKTIIFVTHDIDEAITMGERIAILREGGVLAQYDTPDEILAHPADDFVAQFIGEDRALRRLALHRLGEVELDPVGNPDRPRLEASAASNAPERGLAARRQRREPAARGRRRRRRRARRAHPRPRRGAPEVTAAGGPVIPNFGEGSSCVTGDNLFCWDWVKQHWGDTLQPALVEHIELTAIAVGIGFVLACGLALLAHRRNRAEQPISIVAALLYTFPSIALFQLLVPFTGLQHGDDRDPPRHLHARDPVPEHRRRAALRASGGARGGPRHGLDAA